MGTQILDLSDPQALRDLMGADSSPFLAQFHGNSGSEVENEDEFDAVRPQHVAPVECRPITPESETESDGEENESSNLPSSAWKAGATQPTFMRFEGASGLQTEIADMLPHSITRT